MKRRFSGCNRFRGGYEVSGDQPHFSEMASTMMACMEGMEQEQRFLKALGEVIRFTISGDSLAHYSSDEWLILCFEAVALK